MSLKLDSLLKDKVVLYIVLFFAVTNFFGYVMMNNYDSIITMILAGLITSYFSKNMIVILLVSIISGSLVTGASSINEGVKHHIREGMETQQKNKEEFGSLGSITGAGKQAKTGGNTISVNKGLLDAENDELAALSKAKDPVAIGYEAGRADAQKEEEEKKKEKFSTQQRKKKQYKPASSEIDSKMAGLNETEAAMERLDKILGGASVDTLMKNQEGLTNAMKSMEPLMTKAETMITSLTDSGLIGKLNGMVHKMDSKM